MVKWQNRAGPRDMTAGRDFDITPIMNNKDELNRMILIVTLNNFDTS